MWAALHCDIHKTHKDSSGASAKDLRNRADGAHTNDKAYKKIAKKANGK